jgi:hypothetical protein
LEGRAGQVERFTIQYVLYPCSGDEKAVLEWLYVSLATKMEELLLDFSDYKV